MPFCNSPLVRYYFVAIVVKHAEWIYIGDLKEDYLPSRGTYSHKIRTDARR